MADTISDIIALSKIWPMCYFDIALSNGMADEAFYIVLRYSHSVFGKYKCIKNRGACVDDVIWLVSFTSGNCWLSWFVDISYGIRVWLKLQTRSTSSAEARCSIIVT
jgi:hypothetical protein